jgi:aspartate/tyrosine/aromatic aminotransferase
VQSLSGSGALRLGGTFLSYALPKGTKIYISDPTWPVHQNIFKFSGLTNQVLYPYYDAAKNALNYAGMMDVIGKAEKGSIILFHACAHNPTGIDPTKEQWKEIAKMMKEHELVPFLDSAYQGFATGDLDNDAYAIRLFADEGLQFLVAQSCSKNAGLYGERVGALHIVCQDAETAAKVLSNVVLDIRGMYSNPPLQGARIMGRILNNPAHFAEWKVELAMVSKRLQDMRKLLYDALVANKTPGNWEHILKQIGMFSYTGLTEKQCLWLMKERHVYLLKSGRMSMSGINTKNVGYLATAIHDAVVANPK